MSQKPAAKILVLTDPDRPAGLFLCGLIGHLTGSKDSPEAISGKLSGSAGDFLRGLCDANPSFCLDEPVPGVLRLSLTRVTGGALTEVRLISADGGSYGSIPLAEEALPVFVLADQLPEAAVQGAVESQTSMEWDNPMLHLSAEDSCRLLGIPFVANESAVERRKGSARDVYTVWRTRPGTAAHLRFGREMKGEGGRLAAAFIEKSVEILTRRLDAAGMYVAQGRLKEKNLLDQ